MLLKIESTPGLVATAAWQPHGQAFRVNNKALFLEEVMPRFFKATKFRSFQRQLHLWGFNRIPTGPDAGSWWHQSFVRGSPKDLKHIQRTRVKGTKASAVIVIPNFHKKTSPPEGKLDEEDDCYRTKSATPIKTVLATGSEMGLDDGFNEVLDVLFDSEPSVPDMCVAEYASPDTQKLHGDIEFDTIPSVLELNKISEHALNFTLKKKEANWKDEATPIMVSVGCVRTNGAKITGSDMSGKTGSHEQPRSVIPTSISIPNGCKPEALLSPPVSSPLAVGSCGDFKSIQDDVDDVLDEFSMYIDKMIQFPYVDQQHHD